MKPKIIVIHHAESQDGPEVNWTAIRRYHMSYRIDSVIVSRDEYLRMREKSDGNDYRFEPPYLDIAYQAGVELMGTEYVSVFGRSWFMNGAHTQGFNDRALGLCIVGNFMEAAPVPAQLEKAAEICATWIRLFHLQTSNVFCHSELNQTDCPGKMFYKAEFIEKYLVPKLVDTIQP